MILNDYRVEVEHKFASSLLTNSNMHRLPSNGEKYMLGIHSWHSSVKDNPEGTIYEFTTLQQGIFWFRHPSGSS
jgi:hypothetical protein